MKFVYRNNCQQQPGPKKLRCLECAKERKKKREAVTLQQQIQRIRLDRKKQTVVVKNLKKKCKTVTSKVLLLKL